MAEERIATTAIEKVAYSVDEFCEMFGVGRTFFYAEVKAGRLQVRKAGRKTLVRAEDARAWLDGLSEGLDEGKAA
jgi:excisionase family DNA binding protein